MTRFCRYSWIGHEWNHFWTRDVSFPMKRAILVNAKRTVYEITVIWFPHPAPFSLWCAKPVARSWKMAVKINYSGTFSLVPRFKEITYLSSTEAAWEQLSRTPKTERIKPGHCLEFRCKKSYRLRKVSLCCSLCFLLFFSRLVIQDDLIHSKLMFLTRLEEARCSQSGCAKRNCATTKME